MVDLYVYFLSAISADPILKKSVIADSIIKRYESELKNCTILASNDESDDQKFEMSNEDRRVKNKTVTQSIEARA
jgi:trehalose-6-phosphatase